MKAEEYFEKFIKNVPMEHIMEKRPNDADKRLAYYEYDEICFSCQTWDMLDPNEQQALILKIAVGWEGIFRRMKDMLDPNEQQALMFKIAIGMKDMRDLFLKLARETNGRSEK